MLRSRTVRFSVFPSRLALAARCLFPLVVGLGSGCAFDAYQRAQAQDEPAAYRRFLAEHPEDPNAGDARERLAELELARAEQVHSVLAYKRFLEEFGSYPAGRRAEALLATLHFESASQRHSAHAYRQFLTDHPESQQAPLARQLLKEAELGELDSSGKGQGPDAAPTPDARELERLATAAPGDPRVQRAREEEDRRAFETAKAAGAEALFAYLAQRPTGAFRDAANTELTRWEIWSLALGGHRTEAFAMLDTSVFAAVLKPERARLEAHFKTEAWSLANAAQTRVDHGLRPKAELLDVLEAAEAGARGEAAVELGLHGDPTTFDRLFRLQLTTRNPWTARAAFEALARILVQLPPEVRQGVLAREFQTWRAKGEGSEIDRALAVLEDLSGHAEAAVQSYGRTAHAVSAPADLEPFLVWRVGELRREQERWLSSAVAARQLAVWAQALVGQLRDVDEGGWLGPSRQLCAARPFTARALELLALARERDADVRATTTGFDETARTAASAVTARLRDAEVALARGARGGFECVGDAQAARLAEASLARRRAITGLGPVRSGEGRAWLERLSRWDPDPAVREVAAAALGARRP